MAEVDTRFANASVEFDPQTLAPTYRLHVGHPGASSALAVAARMGLHSDVLARANQLLDREDRRLDRMLSELAASRAALEHEQQEAVRSRAASEALRADYEVKLAALQARRETLYRSMREDLERGFRDAHAQVAAVVRELQSGGSAQDATRAQQRLAELAAEQRELDRAVGPPAAQAPARLASTGGTRASATPSSFAAAARDACSRCPTRAGASASGSAARAWYSRWSWSAPRPERRPRPRRRRPCTATRSRACAEERHDGAQRCDLRGLRVDEALDRLAEALDRAMAQGSASLAIVHGIGTGALRDAVRRHLRVGLRRSLRSRRARRRR